MKKWIALLFVPVIFTLGGVWLARHFFPEQIVNTITEYADAMPPEIRLVAIPSRVQVKWYTKIIDRVQTVEVPPVKITEYKEVFKLQTPSMLFMTLEKQTVNTGVYSPDSSRASLHTYKKIKNDFRLYFDVDGQLHLRQQRNFFDRPNLEIGYLYNEGSYIQTQARVGPLYPTARFSQTGVSYGIGIKIF